MVYLSVVLCSLVPCPVTSLPMAHLRSKMEARWGEHVSFALWPALVPVSPRVALGDEKGCEAGDVFCSPPRPGGTPLAPSPALGIAATAKADPSPGASLAAAKAQPEYPLSPPH